MAESSAPVRVGQAWVALPGRTGAPALYRIPFMLILLGLFLVAMQAGQPLAGFLVMVAAMTSTAALAWRAVTRRHAPALALRDRGDEQVLRGHYAAARSLYEQSLTLALRELPTSAPEVLLNYYSLAAVNSMLYDHDRAALYLDKLFRGLNHRVPFAWAGHVAWLLRRIAHHHSMQGQHHRAVELCERALEIVGEAPGADDHCVRSLLDDLAWIHHHAGDYAAAEVYFRDALALHEQYRDLVLELAQRPKSGRTGSQSPYRAPSPAVVTTSGGLDRATAYSLLGLAWTRYERGDYDEASELFARASLVATGAQGGPGLRVEILRGQAAIEMTQGAYSSAASLYAQAQGILLDRDASVMAASLTVDLGWLARSCRRFADAEQAYATAAAMLERPLEGSLPVRATLHENLAELRRLQGRVREAHREVGQALALAEKSLGPEHPRRASILAVASRIHTMRGDYTEAERCARNALLILRAAVRPRHPRLAQGHVALAELHLARGQYGAAEQAFGEALGIREEAFGPEHPELLEIVEGLSAVLRATGRDDAAEAQQRRAQVLRRAVGCEATPSDESEPPLARASSAR